MQIIAILDALKTLKSIDHLILSTSKLTFDEDFSKRCDEVAHDCISPIIREAME